MPRLCLMTAVLLLSGCAALNPPLMQRTVPPLDSQLAQLCPPLPEPPRGDYDAWQAWMQDQVLVAYGICAARHRETVEAYEILRESSSSVRGPR